MNDGNFKPFKTFGDLLQQAIFPLVVIRNKQIVPVGTGFFINNQGLFITAAHVLEYAAEVMPYEFCALFITDHLNEDGSCHGGLLPINKIWAPKTLDVGFGFATLPININTGESLSVKSLELNPSIPQEKSSITGVGYYQMEGNIDDKRNIDYEHKTAESTGIITEIHPEYRDRIMLPFPCMRTSARFDPGMSGGPVFDTKGKVCGVICSGINEEGNADYISYASLIWPIFGCEIECVIQSDPLDDNLQTQKITIFDLAEKGLVSADQSFKKIEIKNHVNGTKTIVIPKKL